MSDTFPRTTHNKKTGSGLSIIHCCWNPWFSEAGIVCKLWQLCITHLSGKQLIATLFRCQDAILELNDVATMQAGNVRYHDNLPAAVLHGDPDVIVLLMSLVGMSVVSAGRVINMRMSAMFSDFSRNGSGDDAAGHGVDGIALSNINKINDAAVDAI